MESHEHHDAEGTRRKSGILKKSESKEFEP
jgi:hypothetical protein